METLTIRLLHERRSSNRRRKIEGRSGMTYPFLWSDEHKAYIFTTANQEEADDLFNGQGRVMGSYFAPVLSMQKQDVTLSDEAMMGLLERELPMPETSDSETVAKALMAAYDRGRVIAAKQVAKEVTHYAPAQKEAPADVVPQQAAPEAAPTVAPKETFPAVEPAAVAAPAGKGGKRAKKEPQPQTVAA